MRYYKGNTENPPPTVVKNLSVGELLSTHQACGRGFVVTPADRVHGPAGAESPVIFCFERRRCSTNVGTLMYMGACKCMVCSSPSIHSKYYSFLLMYEDDMHLTWMSAKHLAMAIPDAIINPL
jgi:hypothetical protein